MYVRANERSVESSETARPAKGRVVTMIDWDSDKWGNNVHFAANGSWVDDKHADADRREQ
jgi:hypothetical protein